MPDITVDRKAIKELQIWTWIAILLPSYAIFGTVILWSLGLTSQLGMFVVIACSLILFATAGWWWWVISVVGQLLREWNRTQADIQALIDEAQEVREMIIETQQKTRLVNVEKQKLIGDENVESDSRTNSTRKSQFRGAC